MFSSADLPGGSFRFSLDGIVLVDRRDVQEAFEWMLGGLISTPVCVGNPPFLENADLATAAGIVRQVAR
jgi:hypothetical protein